MNNYQSEYDRIRAGLDQSTLARNGTPTSQHIHYRNTKLRNLGTNALGDDGIIDQILITKIVHFLFIYHYKFIIPKMSVNKKTLRKRSTFDESLNGVKENTKIFPNESRNKQTFYC